MAGYRYTAHLVARRARQCVRLLHRELSRRCRKHEANRIDARRERGSHRILARQSTDFYPALLHGQVRAARAACNIAVANCAGLPPIISALPTSAMS